MNQEMPSCVGRTTLDSKYNCLENGNQMLIGPSRLRAARRKKPLTTDSSQSLKKHAQTVTTVIVYDTFTVRDYQKLRAQPPAQLPPGT